MPNCLATPFSLPNDVPNFYWHFLWVAGGMSVTSMVHGKVVMSGTQIVLE